MHFGESLSGALSNPELALRELDRLDAEASLSEFIRQAWRYVDPSTYVHSWHIDAICEHLEAVTAGEIRQLIITVPPRHMKSLSVSVCWPAWNWIKRPELGWLFNSYSHNLTIRDAVKSRRLINSKWYQDNWGDRFSLSPDQNEKRRYDNDKGGYRIATSFDGELTGEGGDIIVIDDPHNMKDVYRTRPRESVLTLWNDSLSTRLNDPKTGAYVIIMQRSHDVDLVGHVIKERGWTHLCLPARYEPEHPHAYALDPREQPGELLWSERFGEDQVRDLEIRLGSYGTAGQLQQRPAPREGGMFERGWFVIVPEAPANAKRVRFWDLAATKERVGTDPDWTAGGRVSVSDGVYYIEDMRRVRENPAGVEKLIKQTAVLDAALKPAPQIWMEQEGGASGKNTIDHYARKVLAGYPFRGVPSSGSKEARADPVSAAAEAGNVKLVAGPWNEAFLSEIEMFPNGAHDDQVDTVSGAVQKLSKPLRHGPRIRTV